MRVARLIRGWMLVAALGAAAGGCSAPEDAPGGPKPDAVTVTSRALNPSYKSAIPRGHELVTRKAYEYLAKRNLLPPILQTEWLGPVDLLVYGNDFADHPWDGVPENPTYPVENHMTNLVSPTGESLWAYSQGNFSFTIPSSQIGSITATVRAGVSIGWRRTEQGRPSTSMRFGMGLSVDPDSSVGWLIDIGTVLNATLALGYAFNPPDLGAVTYPQEFALDNFYHYSLGDLLDVRGPNGERPIDMGGTPDLQIYPMYGEHAAMTPAQYQGWDADHKNVADGVAARVQGQHMLEGSSYGSGKYGAILYQLARKFFSGAQAEPDLAELIKTGGDGDGWYSGAMHGQGELDEMWMSTPHNYLGGMPYVCSGSSSLDPCAQGQPTWPPWITGLAQLELAQREVPRPGQSDRAALIYLGWATHLIQDSATPHHTANWSGKEHGIQDNLGDHLSYFLGAGCDNYTGDCWDAPSDSLDATIMSDVDDLLGTEANPKDRGDICRSVGIDDSQVQAGTLNWGSVYPVFMKTMYTAFQARVPKLPSSDENEAGRQIVANAVLSTIKLLLCAPPGVQPGVTKLCGTANEYEPLTLSCPDGERMIDFPFASYGMPDGQCGWFSHNGSCDAGSSLQTVGASCLGQQSCTINVSNGTFGGDPCVGVVKRLDVQARCAPDPFPPSTCGTLQPGEGLFRGQQLTSCNNTFVWRLSSSGDLTLSQRQPYMSGWLELSIYGPYSVGTSLAGRLVMQYDGNLVLYDLKGDPLWASNTVGAPGSYLRLQDDGNLIVYSPNNEVLWASFPVTRVAPVSVSQSTTIIGATADRANDGNTDGAWWDNSVTHTDYEFKPWWQADLGSVVNVRSVDVYNRTDCCADRLTNFNVAVSQNGVNWTTINTPGQAGSPTNVFVNASGRYVRVQLTGTNYLSLAEVKIWKPQ